MTDEYFVVDIETCPVDLEGYEKLSEEERLKLVNPIDSKIIALGMRYEDQNKIFMGEDEKEILKDFWKEWGTIKTKKISASIVGFNIANFDLPFLTTRSFIHNVTIVPFTLKQVVDVREKINAYRYGKSRGRLKEFASLIGLETKGVDGGDIARLCKEKN